MITTKEACEMLDVSRRTLANYAQEGKIKIIKYSPRQVRYRYAEVCDFMVGRKGE